MKARLSYPNGAQFAFTILDDTDDTTVKNGRPVYNLLNDLGLRTTKTVWAFDTPPENRGPYFAGETLSSLQYLEWVQELDKQGFEIAFHNATMGSSLRNDTIKALDLLEQEFNNPVRLHCNHGQNRENLHWGIDRYASHILKRVLTIWSIFQPMEKFEGNDPLSPFYWSDLADKRLSYIRAFTFRQLNGFRNPPGRPYSDLAKQTGPLFFNTTDAPDIFAFNKIVSPSSIDKLRSENGWAIVSTHLGKGFCRQNSVDAQFAKTMEYVASLPGWFVPASEMLDFIAINTGSDEISKAARARMEYLHIIDKIKGRVWKGPHY